MLLCLLFPSRYHITTHLARQPGTRLIVNCFREMEPQLFYVKVLCKFKLKIPEDSYLGTFRNKQNKKMPRQRSQKRKRSHIMAKLFLLICFWSTKCCLKKPCSRRRHPMGCVVACLSHVVLPSTPEITFGYFLPQTFCLFCGVLAWIVLCEHVRNIRFSNTCLLFSCAG